MKKKLLVVIDMVNGFVNFGALHDRYINHITEGIREVILEYLDRGYDVVAFQDCHELSDTELQEYPVHCLKGTEECELVSELQPFAADMNIIFKNTTNGFKEELFQQFYQERFKEYEDIVVVGCCTDICVTDFTVSLSDFHRERGIEIPIIVPKDLVETFESPGHLRSCCSLMAFQKMSCSGVQLIDHYDDLKNEKRFVL